MPLRRTLCAYLLLFISTTGLVQAQQTLPATPAFSGASVDPAQSMQLFDQLTAVPVREARRTLPQARQRYQAGLQPGEVFYLTTRVVDPDGKFEQVWVQVTQWEGSYVQGTIAHQPETVQTFTRGQQLEFTTSAVLDWTLVRANGVEEGNYVGKFLDIQRHLDALDR